MNIVGILETGSSMIDNGKSFVNISTAQQLLKKGTSYVSTIYANTKDVENASLFSQRLQQLTKYKVEDWTVTNADLLAGDKTRSAMMSAISLSILLVASFGIYNILSATIAQKINDIAILKATGYTGTDVIFIFCNRGTNHGTDRYNNWLAFWSWINRNHAKKFTWVALSGIFPFISKVEYFLQVFFWAFFITLCAGFFPARKAANVDPVSIFRK
ncbi:MAG: ABC transporter permease [Bacteroidetes bacterium]|nr:ABC transporter permease [Bacteroidota bacterium]